jgi:hypothetical protein
MPLCAGEPVIGERTLLVSFVAVGVHTLATLVVTGLIALIVYKWVGLGFLRQNWINFDLLWTGTLFAVGLLLMVIR